MTFIDVELPLLEEIIELLDAHLEGLKREADADPEMADAMVFDRSEYAIGLGFVACQNYVAAMMRMAETAVPAPVALDLGPKHLRSGVPMVALVNAAANYWKHQPELDQEPSGRERRTVEILRAVDVTGVDYKAAVILRELLRPLRPRFSTLLPFLAAWKEDLERVAYERRAPRGAENG